MPRLFLSQNLIEEDLIDYVFSLISPALRPVLVADRGFARAALFRQLQADHRDFVIRIDAQTHVRLPVPPGASRPIQGIPANVLGIEPEQRLWCPEAYYGADDQVPIRLLAVWDEGQQEPWYLATMLDSPELIELLYRWRMRLENANRDEKTGVLLREGGDAHGLSRVLHLHRLLLALCGAEWLCALVGLQAWRDLPAAKASPPAPTKKADRQALAGQGAASSALPSPPSFLSSATGTRPAQPLGSGALQVDASLLGQRSIAVPARTLHAAARRTPPQKGPRLPRWMRPFAARGMLSYVRLGLEVLRCERLLPLLHRLVDWLGGYLWTRTPCWRPRQLRYRLKHWWCDSSWPLGSQ